MKHGTLVYEKGNLRDHGNRIGATGEAGAVFVENAPRNADFISGCR